jgi:hypothetical protein
MNEENENGKDVFLLLQEELQLLDSVKRVKDHCKKYETVDEE